MKAVAATPARRAAFEVLRRVFEEGAWADRALRSVLDRGSVEGRERAHAQRLAYGAVQRRGTSDHLIAELTGRRIARLDPPVVAALRLGLYELLFMDGAADHAAVSQAVELAKGGRGGGRRAPGAGLVNAVLRRAIRERDELLAALGDADPTAASIRHSVPEWICRLWWGQLGPDRARALLSAANEPAPLSYRLTGPIDPGPGSEGGTPLPAALEPIGFGPEGEELGVATPGLVRLPRGSDPEVAAAVEGLRERGRLLPQSLGSALAAALLGAEPGDAVLDLCAAPGIKATQLATSVGSRGRLTAVERDQGRAAQMGELFGSLGLEEPEIVAADAREADLRGGYDRVLVDAPCTGLGTLASRPDLRWRREAADLDELPALQRDLLSRGLEQLRPGGTLVYSVCTISAAESGAVVDAALGCHPGVIREDLGSRAPAWAAQDDPQALQLTPERNETEGFYIARLRKETA